MTNGVAMSDNADNYPIIVIQPGSFNLRFGLSTEICPTTILHCIGRRKKSAESIHHEDEWLPDSTKETSESKLLRDIGLKAARESLSTRHVARGRKRKLTNQEQVLEFNENSEVLHDTDPPADGQVKQWSTVPEDAQFVIGREAFMLSPDAPFNIHWPWKGGKLNIHQGIGGSVSSIIQDLQDIWTTAFRTHLNVDHTNVKQHRAVLLISDSYKRSDVRELVDLLLSKIGFHSIFIAQESMCATFEEGLMCGCVVDVGDRKTSICCIEDGMIKSTTLMLLQVGGSDITCCFHWLLNKSGFPVKDINTNVRFNGMFMQELKESYCHLDQNIDGMKDFEITYSKPSTSSSSPQAYLKFILRFGDERILAPMSLFFPEMFGLKVNGAPIVLRGGKKVSDPSDVNDEDYLRQTMTKHEIAARQRRRDQAESTNQVQDSGLGEDSQLNDFDGYDQFDLRNQMEDECDVWNLMGLHHLIIKSIEQCESEEVRQKMYANILLVGGGAMLPGAKAHLTLLLTNQMRLNGKLYEVNVLPKESCDVSHTAWKGACIMSCLDTSQELWIKSRQWTKYGIRALRERIPFNW